MRDKVEILHAMTAPLSPLCRKALTMMLSQITKLPGGYCWWHSLPAKGKKAQRAVLRRWTRLLTAQCYPQALQQAMIHASLNTEGVPDNRSMALYTWLLRQLYRGNAAQLHHDWTQLQSSLSITSQRHTLTPPHIVPPTQHDADWSTYPPTHRR